MFCQWIFSENEFIKSHLKQEIENTDVKLCTILLFLCSCCLVFFTQTCFEGPFVCVCGFVDGGHEEESVSKGDGFEYTVDLVKFIRREFGDHFTVGVVGK